MNDEFVNDAVDDEDLAEAAAARLETLVPDAPEGADDRVMVPAPAVTLSRVERMLAAAAAL